MFPTVGLLRILVANVPVLIAVGLVAKIVTSDFVTLVLGIAAVAPAYALGLWATHALSPFEKEYVRGRLASVRER